MPEPSASEARLQALRRRWEAEKSTAFLPLAEEYRRLGRLREAIDVLQTGLKSNPNYTSGLVALGRCRLESGDAPGAASVLERVVAQDPEQLVASKLLIEAYLRTGKAREAGRRLDLYSKLNAKDPEIARLADRLRSLAAPAPPAMPASSPAAAASPPSRAAAEDVAPESLEIEDRTGTADPAFVPSPPSVDALALPAGDRLLFLGLDGPVAVSRYVRGLVSEGLFSLIFPAATPQPAAKAEAAFAAQPLVVEETVAEPLRVEEPEVEPVPPSVSLYEAAVPEPVLEPFEADVERAVSRVVPVAPAPPVTAEEAPAPSPALTPPPAASETATLGDLYLQQGHAADAHRIFGAVLGREPQNDDARRGLGEAQAQLRQAGGLSARRAGALRDYLRRLTRREERDVP